MVIAAATTLWAANMAWAQMGLTLTSLESLVAHADVVVRASIADVTREEPDEQWVSMHVTLKVDETLKGRPEKSVTFAIRTIDGDQRYQQWHAARQQQLWFFVYNKPRTGELPSKDNAAEARHRLKPNGSMIRLGEAVPDETSFSKLPPPILTMDLYALEAADEILEAARKAAGQRGKRNPVRSHAIWLPRSIAQRSGSSGDINHLVVPADHRLEALARRLIETPNGFLRPEPAVRPELYNDPGRRSAWFHANSNLLRAEGVKALRQFKSDRNIALLLPLLDDPAWSYRTIQREDRPPVRHREYYLRKEAYSTLRQWGVDVKKPVLKERAPAENEAF
ncbi:MAG: hypothetical protein WD278_10200 [Pirellulales bacterium]